MIERIPFVIAIDKQDQELLPENHGVAMFRKTPEYDYIDLTLEEGLKEEETKHIVIFRYQWLCYWMAGFALNGTAQLKLSETVDELGHFKDRFSWNSRVFVEDEASEAEVEMYTESLMNDLRNTAGVPEEWDE